MQNLAMNRLVRRGSEGEVWGGGGALLLLPDVLAHSRGRQPFPPPLDVPLGGGRRGGGTYDWCMKRPRLPTHYKSRRVRP